MAYSNCQMEYWRNAFRSIDKIRIQTKEYGDKMRETDLEGSYKSAAPAIEKMIRIIELLAHSDRGYNYTEISRLTDTPFNSVYRICMELEAKKYIVKQDGLLHIGPSFYIIGKAAEQQMKILSIARPFMADLAQLTHETVHITRLDDQMNMILVEQIETEYAIRMSVATGTEMITHASAFGKCMLAWNDWQGYAQRELPSCTSRTITGEKELGDELARIRACGYAIDNEEYVEGVRCIGAPIFGSDGKCIAAMGVLYLLYRYDDAKEEAGIRAVVEAASKISKLLKDGNISAW